MATTAQCKRAITLFEDKLSVCKNFVGLGIVPADEEKSPVKEMAVAVYVTEKLPLGKLRQADVVPKHLVIPGRRGQLKVLTRVIEQGAVHLE
jgi:hypothetical protein